MRLLARLHGWFPAALTALAGACMYGCGYDFDAAFSEGPVPAEASAPDAAIGQEAAVDASVDEPSVDSSEASLADVGSDTASEADSATADVQEDVSHCGNGKQDGDETGVDCGGSCNACAPETCTNQSDDDKDGKTDCADDDCGQFTCVAAAGVAGWVGPVMVRSGNGCDDGLPPLYSGGWGGLTDTPVCSGSSCSCGSPSGQSCPAPTLAVYDANNCVDAPETIKLLPGNCVDLPGGVDGIMLTPATPVNGGCQPGGNPGVPGPVHWSVPTVVCGLGAGCPPGGVCTTPPVGWGNDRFLCIVREGSHACPVGWGLQGDGKGLATQLPTNYDCAPCACSTPAGGICQGQHVDGYSTGMGCVFAAQPLLADGQCNSSPLTAVEWTDTIGIPQGSTCAPSLPTVQGPLEATGFVTVCCIDKLP